MSAALDIADPFLGATRGPLRAEQALPERPLAPAGRRPRLRDHGVTPLFILTVFLLTLASQLGIVGYIVLVLHITDGVVEQRNPDTLAGFAVLYVFIIVVSAMLLHLRGKLVAAAAERFGLTLQAQAMQAAVRNAVRVETGSGLQVLQDIGSIRRFIAGRSAVSVFDLSGSAIGLALLFYLDEGLGWIGVGGIILVAGLGIVVHYASRAMVKRSKRHLAETFAELSGQLVHPDLTRGLGLLPATMFRWQGRYDGALRSLEGTQKRVNALTGIEELFTEFYHLAIKIWACLLLFAHVGSLGLLIAAWHFSGMVVGPFSTITRSWERWSFAIQAWRRLGEVLAADAEPPAQLPEPDAAPGLSIEGVGFWPEGRPRPVLAGLQLHLAPGTAITVEGPNGVGKSTLLRVALGLLAPTEGRVLLDGQDTHFCDRAVLGPRIGYLPQDVQLLEGSIYDNIGRGPDAPAIAVVEAARAAGAHDLIGRLPHGYQTPAGATSGLSAGQRRLIGLARALYGRPRLLVMDEPEVGLDGGMRTAMRNAVAAMREAGGVTLVVTHEPDTWAAVTDLRLLLGPGGTWQVQPTRQDEPAAAEEDSLEPVA